MATQIKPQDIDTTQTFVLSASQFSDGTFGSPSLAFSSQTSLGFFKIGSNNIGVTGTTFTLENDAAKFQMLRSSNGRIGYIALRDAFGSIDLHSGLNGAGEASNIAYQFAGDAPSANTIYATILGTGQFQFSDGVVASPALSFQSDPDTGFYHFAANAIGISTAGTLKWTVDASGDWINQTNASRIYTGDGSAANPSFNFSSDQDTGIYHPGANGLSIATGGAQVWTFDSAGAFVGNTSGARIYVADGAVNTPSITFNADQDTGIYRLGANQVGIAGNATQIALFDATVGNNMLTLNQNSSSTIFPLSMSNTAVGSNPNASVRMGLTVNDGNAGDPYMIFAIGGPTRYWSIGIDNSNSDVLAISTTAGGTAAPGTGDIALFTSNGFQMIDGSASNPSISFINQSSTGIYRPASNAIAFVLGSAAAKWQMDSTGLQPPSIDGGTTFGGFGERRALNLGTTTDITPDIDASGFIQVRTFNNVNTASSTALYYWWSSATDAGITTIVAPTGSGGPTINSVTIVSSRTLRFNIGAFSGGSAYAFFVRLHSG